MKLSSLKAGESATVLKISADIRRDLYEVGLTEGVKITVIRYAAFNGPIEIYLRGFYLALRMADADEITVKPL